MSQPDWWTHDRAAREGIAEGERRARRKKDAMACGLTITSRPTVRRCSPTPARWGWRGSSRNG